MTEKFTRLTAEEIRSMKTTDLYELAKGNVANYKAMKKADLINALIALLPAPAPTADAKLSLTDDEQAEAKEAGEMILRAKDVAAMLGTTPYNFRSFLRTADGGYDDKRYTRYGWTANSPELARVIKAWKLFQEALKAGHEAKEAAKVAKAQAAATADVH